uniref:aliphatic sulfonate ABC transporter substrate-binding protein n=1 Tax=Castellaniella defragrans TaxID=75697 RepID=UPI00333EB198
MKATVFLSHLLAGGLLAISTPHATAEVRIGYAPNTFYAPILVAKQKNWVQEELSAVGSTSPTVKWQSFSAGPMMNEAIAAGQLDVIFTGDVPAIIGKSVGFEISLIGISSSGYRSQAGVVLANSPISSVKDIKGKRVATFKGTTAHHLLVLALEEAGLKLSDIELVNLTLPDMNNALLRGEIDAAFLWEPLLSKLELDQSIKVLRDGVGQKNAIAVIEATDSFVTKNRNEAKAVLKAFQKGAELIRRDPDAAAHLIAAELNQPEAIIRHSLDKFTYGPAFSKEIMDALSSTETFLREQNLMRSPVDINRFADHSLLNELEVK